MRPIRLLMLFVFVVNSSISIAQTISNANIPVGILRSWKGGDREQCTCFIMGDQQTVITAAHCVDDFTMVLFYFKHQTTKEAGIALQKLHVDRKNDIAVLRAPKALTTNFFPVKFPIAKPKDILNFNGYVVDNITFQKTEYKDTVTFDRVAPVQNPEHGIDTNGFWFSHYFPEGNSGGPIFDNKFQVVGIQSQGVRYRDIISGQVTGGRSKAVFFTPEVKNILNALKK